ncbi:hypothetical protein MMC18_002030 [Xylographa bjoerkii]|nr:hypothetical protein [Xylographa bjoerkii]
MAFLKSSPRLRSLLVQPSRIYLPRSITTQQHRLYAQQSYGGGEGDPKGETPQQQGSNRVSADKEHPGPPPPDVGKGTGGGPTKAGSDGNDAQQHGGAGSSSGAGSSGSTPSKSGASPKIHSENIPAEESAEVKKHNEELEKRHDRASNKVDDDGRDNVNKKFWSGKTFIDAFTG